MFNFVIFKIILTYFKNVESELAMPLHTVK